MFASVLSLEERLPSLIRWIPDITPAPTGLKEFHPPYLVLRYARSRRNAPPGTGVTRAVRRTQRRCQALIRSGAEAKAPAVGHPVTSLAATPGIEVEPMWWVAAAALPNAAFNRPAVLRTPQAVAPGSPRSRSPARCPSNHAKGPPALPPTAPIVVTTAARASDVPHCRDLVLQASNAVRREPRS